MNTYTLQKNLVGRYRVLVNYNENGIPSILGEYETPDEARNAVKRLKEIEEANRKMGTWKDVEQL